MQQIKVDTSGLIDGEIPDANDALAALIDLKLHLENTLNGVQPFDVMNFGAAEALTISAGVVTLTKSPITLAGQGAAADDLDTINGGAEGDVVLIRSSTDAYAITLKHGTGNLRTPTGADIVLSNSNGWAIGLKTATNWLVAAQTQAKLRERLSSTLLDTMTLKAPDRSVKADGSDQRLLYLPSLEAGNSFAVRAANPDIAATGIAAPTSAAPGGSAYEIFGDGPYFRMSTAASAGSAAGLISTTFNLVRPAWNPTFLCKVELHAFMDSLRYWIGLCGAAPSNADDAGTPFIGFRYSTVAGDVGWRPVVRSSTTQNVGANIGTAQGLVTYTLTFRVNSDNGVVYFQVDGGAEQVLTANLPDVTQDMGFAVRLFATSNALRRIYFYKLEVQMK